MGAPFSILLMRRTQCKLSGLHNRSLDEVNKCEEKKVASGNAYYNERNLIPFLQATKQMIRRIRIIGNVPSWAGGGTADLPRGEPRF